jgi:hypothetical protein
MIIYDKNKKLVDQLSRSFESDDNWSFPKFNHIKVGNNFAISIQANENSYCSPRDNFEFASDYDNFEIALFKSSGIKWEIFQPRDYFPAERFDWVELFEEGDCSVAGWVTPSKIEKIIIDMLHADPLMCFA